jgi:hypothetical protein
MRALRLGDDIDDFCAKCKRITNHVIVSFTETEPALDRDPAKVRCRSCYHEHDYLNEEDPKKKA